jgi:hypothetical protein
MPDQILAPGPLNKPLQIAVTVHDRTAVLHFSEPREYVALNDGHPFMIGQRLILAGVEARPDLGQTAIAVAMALIDGIYEMRSDLKPAGGAVKHELIERHRRTLTKRLEVIMNSQREKKTVSNHLLAKELVDVMLREVFA